MSKDAQAYFAAGGTGILIGDGQLPHYSTEQIMEAYNADRGPVSIWGLRLHAEF